MKEIGGFIIVAYLMIGFGWSSLCITVYLENQKAEKMQYCTNAMIQVASQQIKRKLFIYK